MAIWYERGGEMRGEEAKRRWAEGSSHHEIMFRGSWEERQAQEELSSHTSERPHVDRNVIRAAKNDLRRAIEARLDVGVHRAALEASRPEIDELDLARSGIAEEDVLWLQVAMDNRGVA
jgi:hypothetical protein